MIGGGELENSLLVYNRILGVRPCDLKPFLVSFKKKFSTFTEKLNHHLSPKDGDGIEGPLKRDRRGCEERDLTHRVHVCIVGKEESIVSRLHTNPENSLLERLL